MGSTSRGWQGARHITSSAIATCLFALAASCGDGAATDRPVAGEPVVGSASVLSKDGIIAAHFPADLVVFAFSDAITGTSVDGGLRIYIRHLPPDGLVRAAGAIRGDLVARGWAIEGERHFETAVELRSSKGHKVQHVARVTWVIERDGRLVLCEGIARGLYQDRLDDPLRRRCQRLEVNPL